MAKFQIQVLVDESAGIHPLDPVGVVIMRQGHEELRSRYSLMDLWFYEMIQGWNQLQETEQAWVDFSDEGSSLSMRQEGPKIYLLWQEEELCLTSGEFLSALRKAVGDMLSYFDKHEEFERSETLVALQNWLKVA